MTGTDVAVAERDRQLIQEGGYGYSSDDVKLIAEQVCKPKERMATYSELRLFLTQCQRTGLDPLARQVYAIFRKDHGVEKMTIQTGIDGFRLIAQRTGQYLGQEGPFWFDPELGEWVDVWLKESDPPAAKVIVKKALNGLVAETPAVAHMKEYRAQGPMWNAMPANQIAKCAEALALRKAFPNDLSGIYVAEEMDKQDAGTPSFEARAQAMEQRDAEAEAPSDVTPPPAPDAAPADAEGTAEEEPVERERPGDDVPLASLALLPRALSPLVRIGLVTVGQARDRLTSDDPLPNGVGKKCLEEYERVGILTPFDPNADLPPASDTEQHVEAAEAAATPDADPAEEPDTVRGEIERLLKIAGEDDLIIQARLRGASSAGSLKGLLTYAEAEAAKVQADAATGGSVPA